MGASCASFYANVVLHKWEHTFVLIPPWKQYILFYRRYLDDICILWGGSQDELRQFFCYINSTTNFLQFTHTVDPHELHYLDITLYKDYTQNVFHLHFESAHPLYQKRGIIKGQLIRASRICSTQEEFELEVETLQALFLERGYPLELFRTLAGEVSSLRNSLYPPILGKGSEALINSASNTLVHHTNSFAYTYSSNSKEMEEIIMHHWPVLALFEELKDFIPPKPSFVRKRGANFKEIFERKHDSKKKVKQPRLGTHRCGSCAQCHAISNESSLYIPSRNFRVHPTGFYTCATKGVVYLGLCTTCQSFYVGKTERELRKRIYEHLYDMAKKKETNAFFKHSLSCPGLNIKFTVLEQVELDARGGDWESTLGYRELLWQLRLDAGRSPGLNGTISIKPVLKLRRARL
ncbi:uncharacterized protein LOC122789274 [Protopterus annectens]|uniref:uncharacterized protein LOC122789274 n=1 Tax=Protopterus annectens TaxID=7888 RepID=UPI001CFA1103|nr:uncharacterized protein LOC122789274 [Protopterus annectens]